MPDLEKQSYSPELIILPTEGRLSIIPREQMSNTSFTCSQDKGSERTSKAAVSDQVFSWPDLRGSALGESIHQRSTAPAQRPGPDPFSCLSPHSLGLRPGEGRTLPGTSVAVSPASLFGERQEKEQNKVLFSGQQPNCTATERNAGKAKSIWAGNCIIDHTHQCGGSDTVWNSYSTIPRLQSYS